MLIVLNNKSNFTLKEYEKYLTDLNQIKTTEELVLCPSFPYLSIFNSENISLGGQNVSKNVMGAHTGEVNALQLKALNTKYCLVGHSERRSEEKETDNDINTKIKLLINEGITPILCIGETKKEHEKEETLQVINCSLTLDLDELTEEEKSRVIIAYEPVWCIGTENIPSHDDLNLAMNTIKKTLPNNKILYGGSVNENNIEILLENKNIDGFLLGGLSLHPDKLQIFLNTIEKRQK